MIFFLHYNDKSALSASSAFVIGLVKPFVRQASVRLITAISYNATNTLSHTE